MDARRSFYLTSDHDDHAELAAKADRSNAVAVPYVTPANDSVPTSLRLRAHCRALLRRLVAGGSPRSASCDYLLRDSDDNGP
jgi:hypothetical protein